MKEIEIKSLADFIEQISNLSKAHQTHLHLRLWFRGVSKATYGLTPSVFRSHSRTQLVDDERHAFRDFRLWSAGMIPIGTTLEDLYFKQQHHGLPTRLLDWTTNALIALYFAVEKDPAESAALYAMDAYGLGEHEFVGLSGKKFRAGGFAVSNNDPDNLLTVALAEIVLWRKDVKPPDFIFPVRPAFTDIRLQVQRGCFTYHPPSVQELTEKENSSLCKMVFPPAVKRDIKEQLLHLGMDHFSVYGDVDSLAITVKSNFNLGGLT
jgi:FRG domain